MGSGVTGPGAMGGSVGPAVLGTRPVLVTGGAGFIGCNLADRLAAEGHDVLVFDAMAREGVERNLAWLKRRHPRRVSSVVADVRDRDALEGAVEGAEAVFHLAAQVAVTTSLVEPEADFEVNVRGTLFLLEALRRRGGRVPLVFASTNKVYGDLGDVAVALADLPSLAGGGHGPGAAASRGWLPEDEGLRAHGISEARPLSFHTPYGCSKGAADQYVLDYARSFGVPACVLRMSCIYGPRQMGTEDQGWLAHFLLQVLAGQPISIYGDGRQVRDVLYVDDAVDAYLACWRRIGEVSGRALNLGGGAGNAVTLRAAITELEAVTGRRASLSFDDWRPGDQRYFVADSREAARVLGLGAPIGWRDGLRRLAHSLAGQAGAGQADGAAPERVAAGGAPVAARAVG